MRVLQLPTNWRPVAGVLLDLDGTLADTLGDFVEALGHTLAELGLPPATPQAVAARIGRGSEHLVRSTLQHAFGGDAARADAALPAVLPRYLAHYAAANGRHAVLYPGAADGVAALAARGWPIGCVTNKPTAYAEALLAQLGIRPHFARVAGGDAYARHKPHPEPLLGLCAAFGLAPASVWMLGDSGNDAAAARAAGCPVLLVPYGFNHGRDVAAEDCDGVIPGVDAALSWWQARGLA